MGKIQFTYLIGAGASANTIPVVRDFAEKLFGFAKYIGDFKITKDSFENSPNASERPSEIKKLFIKEIEWLANECAKHSSVDTYARKLFLSNHFKELLKLKTIVSEFLLVEQLLNGIDKRYDAFFATILEKKDDSKLTLPDNIRILSWNYDKQIEFSIAQFLNSYENDYVEDFLNVFPNRNNTILKSRNKFSLFKLNGTIGGIIENGKTYKPIPMDYNVVGTDVTKEQKEKIIKWIFFRFSKLEDSIIKYDYTQDLSNTMHQTILYSWEKNELLDFIRESALETIKNTEILIIIGYSFPTFNRNMDKKIIQNMKLLRKVFIQSPEATIKGVVQRFKSIYQSENVTNDIEIKQVTDVEEFYIPFEY